MKPLRLLLVDDQDLIRESLHIVLDMDQEIEVVGMAENGSEAVSFCEAQQPDVILMDVHMPIMDGVEATRIIKQRWPEIHIIILTTFQELNFVIDALSAGAEGYLLKAIHPKELATGIKWVCQGGTLIPQDIAMMLVNKLKHHHLTNPVTVHSSADVEVKAANHPILGNRDETKHDENKHDDIKENAYGLSEREFQVLQLVSNGLNNKEIADRLFLSEGTVKNYISSIYSKMNVRDRIQALKKASDEGMV